MRLPLLVLITALTAVRAATAAAPTDADGCVEGNTDNVGNPQSNMALSLARAQSVVSAVVAGEIAASRMTAVGHGQDNPVADTGSEDGRAQNRRVDLVKK